MLPRIAIWRSDLLPLSETFIFEQTRALEHYEPVFFGKQRMNEALFPLDRTAVIRTHRTAREHLETVGYSITRRSRTLRKAMVEFDPVLIHAHFGTEAVFALPYKREFGVPLVTTFHGYDATRGTGPAQQRFSLNWAIYQRHLATLRREGDLFIAVSSFIRERLLELGFPRERTVVHHIGVNTKRLEFRPRPASPCGERVVTIARLVEKKGTADLVAAISLLAARRPALHLVIIGDGPERPRLETIVERLGLRERVTFLGSLPHDRAQAELLHADVFCLPSITAANGETEGLPMVVLEAQARGVPVIATRHGGIPEAVRDGSTGLLVPERKPPALANAISRLLDDPILASTLAARARAEVERSFSLQRQTRALEDLYDRVLTGNRVLR